MRIALMRTGTVIYADNKDASPVAGNQDALGVLRYLKDAGHEVCLFGPAPYSAGEARFGEHEVLGVKSFGVDFSGLGIKTAKGGEVIRPPANCYDLVINMALADLRRWEPQVCVNVAGQQPSHSNPGNPWGCKPQYTAISTNYPMLKACEDLKLPRIVILNDPRNLPREQENIYMSGTIPAAVLSQRAKTTYWQTERAGKMQRVEAYAACENWWSYGMLMHEICPNRRGTVIIAHAHFHDLRVKGPKRAEVWKSVLKNYKGDCLEIYGHGWPEDQPNYKGMISHDEVQGKLNTSMGGPMIALEAGFASGKLREYVVAGALPRPISWGDFHYDKDNRYMAANHPGRIRQYEEWTDLWDIGYVEELREKTKPDFDPLEHALEVLAHGHNPLEHGLGGYKWT